MDKHMRVAKLALAFSASALMVAVAVHLLGGASPSQAETQIDGSGGIVALQVDWRPETGVDGWRGDILLEDGQVYSFTPCGDDFGFTPTTLPPLPVPVNQIKLWGLRTIVTLDNEVWTFPIGSCGTDWVNLGQPPALPISASGESTSTIKRRY